jgi:hypothetical protein
MTLYAGVPLKPGDQMELEFQTPGGARVAAVVRNRTGYCFGLEFLTPLGAESSRPPAVRKAPTAEGGDVRAVLRRKEVEMERLRKEIAALKTYSKPTP